MAIFYPDILEHNNPARALVSYSQLRGNAYAIDTLNNTGSIPSDKRSTGQIIFTSASGKFYAFIAQNTASWDTPSNWKEIATADMVSSAVGNTFASMSVGGVAVISDSTSGSLTIASGSFAGSATTNNNLLISASAGNDTITFSLVDSPTFTAVTASNALITNNLVVGGRVTAQEFHTELVSASIIYESGSTQFGNSSDDTHIFTGSLRQSGSDSYFLGNVGINTTSPNARLHISGVNNQSLLQVSSPSATNALFVSGSGRVGIGTSSPQSQLHIYTNQSPYIGLFSRVENTGGTIVSASAIQTKIDALNVGSYITDAYNINILNSSAAEGLITNLYGVHVNLLNSGSGTNNWAIYTSGSTKSYFGGKVGLNVTDPSYRLQVKGNIDTESLLKVEGSTNTFIEVNDRNVLISGSNVHLSGSLYFSASSAGGALNSVLVRDNTTGQIKLTGSYGGGGGGVTLPPNLLSGSGTPTYIALYSGSNFLSSSNIFQNSNGFIGIGTTTPQTLLQVGGRFSADTNGSCILATCRILQKLRICRKWRQSIGYGNLYITDV